MGTSLDESILSLSNTWGLSFRIHDGTTHTFDSDTDQLLVYNRPLLLPADIITYMHQYAATYRLRIIAYKFGLPINKAFDPN